jgi:hypothetical protein
VKEKKGQEFNYFFAEGFEGELTAEHLEQITDNSIFKSSLAKEGLLQAKIIIDANSRFLSDDIV